MTCRVWRARRSAANRAVGVLVYLLLLRPQDRRIVSGSPLMGVDNDPLSSAEMMFPSVCPTRTAHMDEIVIRPEKRPRGTGAGAKQAGTDTLHATRSPPGRPRGFPSLFPRACGRLAIHLLHGYKGRTRVSTCLLAVATGSYHGS